MVKGIVNRIKMNFRQSSSDRKATNSYRAFGKYIKNTVNKSRSNLRKG